MGGSGCPIGDEPCATTTTAPGGGTGNVYPGTVDNFKEFCSGLYTEPFSVTNNESYAIDIEIDCGGTTPAVFTLGAGRSAYITKDSGCEIDPIDPCIYQ